MNILMAAGEAVPFCKTGGLADVVGALTRILSRMGHAVRLFLPYYRAVEGGGHSLEAVPGRFLVPVGGELLSASLLKASWGASTVYFVQNQRYFGRDGFYQDGGRDFQDNDERFIFFCRSVLEAAKFVDFKPDVIHCHDWQAALIPAYLKTLYRIDAFFARARSVQTIHNLAYQGTFPKDTLFLAGFGWADYTPERLEYYGGFNFLKAGLVFADLLTTVSPTYAREVQSSAESGRGLEGILRHRSKDFHGILNGVDTEVWNPETDPALARNYGPESVREGKAAGKEALRRECGLASGGERPLCAVVSRLDPQKGLDVVLETLPRLLERAGQLAALGTGDPRLQQAFARAAERANGAVCFRAAFDEALSHRIYAAADLFLMPSRFEPCGLGQRIAMRYGAVPVVTRTGGLADTVSESPEAGGPNGFVAPACSPEDFGAALERALSAYGRREAWEAIRARAMAVDPSWERSAALYVGLYDKALSA